MYQAAEKVQEGLARGEVSAGDAATLLGLFAKKKFVYKPFWRSVGKSLLPLLPLVDAKGLALILNAFANVGVVNRRLLREAADLIVLGNSTAQQQKTQRLQGSNTDGFDLSPVEAEDSLSRGNASPKKPGTSCGDEGTPATTTPKKAALPVWGHSPNVSEPEAGSSSEGGPAARGLRDTGNAFRREDGVEDFLVPSALNAKLKRGEMSVSGKCYGQKAHTTYGTFSNEGIACRLPACADTPPTGAGTNSPFSPESAKEPLGAGGINKEPVQCGEERLEDLSSDVHAGTVLSLRCQVPQRSGIVLKDVEMTEPGIRTPAGRGFEGNAHDSIFTVSGPDTLRAPSTESILPQQGRYGKNEEPYCTATMSFSSVPHPLQVSNPARGEKLVACVGENSSNIGGEHTDGLAGKVEREGVNPGDHEGHASTALVKRMNAQDIALVANAFAKLGVKDLELYAALADNIPAVLSQASALQLVTLFAAYSKLDIHDVSVYRAITDELLREGAYIGKEYQPGFPRLPPKITELDAGAVAVLLNCIQKAQFDNPHLACALLTHLEETRSAVKGKKRTGGVKANAAGDAAGRRVASKDGFETGSRHEAETQSSQYRGATQPRCSGNSESESRARPSAAGEDASSGRHRGQSRSIGMPQANSDFRLYHDLGPREVSLTLNALTRLPHPKSLRSAIVTHASKLLSSMNDTDVLITTKALIRLHSKLGHSDAENLFLQIRSRFRAHGCGIRELAALATALQRLVALAPQLQSPAKTLVQEIAPRVTNRLYKLENRTFIQLASAFVTLHASEENTTQEILVEISRRLPDLELDEKLAALHVVYVFSSNGIAVALDIAPFIVRSILDTIDGLKEDRLSKWGAAGAKTLVTAATELRDVSGSLMDRLILAVSSTVPLMSQGQTLSVAIALLSCCNPAAHTAGERSMWKALISGLVYPQARAIAQVQQETDFSVCHHVPLPDSSDCRERHADASDAIIDLGECWSDEDHGNQAALEAYSQKSITGEVQAALCAVASEMWQARVNDFILKEGRNLKLRDEMDTMNSGDVMQEPGDDITTLNLSMLLFKGNQFAMPADTEVFADLDVRPYRGDSPSFEYVIGRKSNPTPRGVAALRQCCGRLRRAG
ncbi:conserved hypothetical protein [Neospora caninum Liverpool]|uniref:Uncharacterized protein n=1 Tax=Neospora caninum (strain Liverpool) TaxID=572307 RepID=F0VH96_NEOCL|nr:conserved hypothetical protein [Neospora caninum Liverpool]CBZ53090.1 conserved hypothetical protein [Neospora caninum Liverpool]|eukprot:XP_003883122.1 conserved hypothetical protein [Neospora caninum Liverpool]